jgi:4-amino-4-deoxy-L-arabinose transferase-like glycosyltransferase
MSVAEGVARSLPRGEGARVSVAEVRVVAGLVAFGAALFAIRLTGLPNLLDNEYRVGPSALDVLQHGNWLCPHDILGNTDKPPMLVWLVALASWPFGAVTRFTIYLPTAIATVLTAQLIASAGRRHFGGLAGALGAFAYLCSHVGAQQMGTARWDGLFTLPVAIAALAAFNAWMVGGEWTRFWLAGAVATLTKGPLGVILAAFGLLAVPWEHRNGWPRPLTGSQAPGIGLYVALTIGWFVLAYLRVGPHLVDDMIRGELVGHVVEHHVGYRFYKPFGDVLANFAPWSAIAIVGLYRIVTAPAVNDGTRCFERFLFCWFVGGLLLFALSPHNQARLLAPTIPPLALIAGRELDRVARHVSPRVLRASVAVVALSALAVFGTQYHYMERRNPEVQQTLAIERLAATVRTAVGSDFPLMHTAETPHALQLSLNTMRPPVTIDEAAALLRGETAAFVVVRDLPGLERAIGSDATALHELAHAGGDGVPPLYLVSNRPTLAWEDPTAIRIGPLVVSLTGTRLGPTWDNTIALRARQGGGAAEIDNASRVPQQVHVWRGMRSESRTLDPDEVWRLDVDGRAR